MGKMVKFENKIEEVIFSNNIFKGEIARHNMVIFCEHFKKSKTLSKDKFFELQKQALKRYGEIQDE